MDHGAFRITPAHLPCERYTAHRSPPHTTFFSRHGLRSWCSSSIRMVSRPTLGTSFRLTASATISRTVQRARPAGGCAQIIATILCCWSWARIRAGPGRCFSYSARPGLPSRNALRSPAPPWAKDPDSERLAVVFARWTIAAAPALATRHELAALPDSANLRSRALRRGKLNLQPTVMLHS